MAEIKFYANVKAAGGSNIGTANQIQHSAGSGLGFYGNGFGVSVPVGGQQTQTYVTNADGTAQGPRLNNTAMSVVGNDLDGGTPAAEGQVSINGGAAVPLSNLPNMSCPLNVRFTHSEAVKVQNCKLRIFDRTNIGNHASGVSTYVYEARHPSNTETDPELAHKAFVKTESNPNKWVEFAPGTAMVDFNLTPSPGTDGTNTTLNDPALPTAGTTDGDTHNSLQHDWYLALSSEPDSIGSKTNYALYVTLEYLA